MLSIDKVPQEHKQSQEERPNSILSVVSSQARPVTSLSRRGVIGNGLLRNDQELSADLSEHFMESEQPSEHVSGTQPSQSLHSNHH